MSKESIYALGVQTLLLTNESTHTLQPCAASEPVMLRNLSLTECTVSPSDGETINGGSSITLKHEACCYLHPSPNGTDWKYIHHNNPISGRVITKTGGTHNDIDATGVNVILADADSDIRIGGFQNGVSGQVIHIAKTNTTGKLILEDDEAGNTQKIKTDDTSDESEISNGKHGGFTLVCDGTFWYEIDKP